MKQSGRDRNFYLPKEIPKQSKKDVLKKKREEADKMRADLSTPTTENLRNTFVIKNSSESFETYHHQMKKRKNETIKNKESI